MSSLQTQVSSLQTQVNNLSTSVDLRGVTPNWDKNLPSASRFTVLTAFNNQAVRDNNTGLVWEQAPASPNVFWGFALVHCEGKTVGGTTGWRLPSVVELNSVRDPSLSAPFVPASVFTGVQSAAYVSATTNANNSGNVWFVIFVHGTVSNFRPIAPFTNKIDNGHTWCVRGEMNADQY